jgi:hypothetical protein
LVAAPLSLVALLAGTGCSARVDVSTERPTGGESPAVEKFHTNVVVDVQNPVGGIKYRLEIFVEIPD